MNDQPHTTYTLLVTIAHDPGAAPSTDLLEVIVQRGLEEGVREFAGVSAATVSVIEGDAVRFPLNNVDPAKQAKKLHKALRA